MDWFFRFKLHHVSFWLVYYIFWILVTMYSYHYTFLWAFFLVTLYGIGQAIPIYTVVYRIIPTFFRTRNYLVLLCSLIICVAAGALFITLTALPFIRLLIPNFNSSFLYFFGYSVMGVIWMIIIFTALKNVRGSFLRERRQQLLEKEKTENELQFLKSQMNPHFLFNAINSIYILIKKDPDVAAGTLAKFADMLRYQLYECNTEVISIDKEVAYLHNYIEVEQLRKGSTVVTHFEVAPEVAYFSIAPLLIIPFVENAYKHVSSFTDRPNTISIALRCRDEYFELEVENTTDTFNIAVDTTGKKDGGIGLENVKRRLALIYPGRHHLHIHITADTYKILLRIHIR